MERPQSPRILPCPQNLIQICSSPDGPKTDKHHELPQCLNRMAKAERKPKAYRDLLAATISHAMNGIEICWCLHHKYGVQGLSETSLPTTAELQGRLERWNGRVS